MNLKSVIHHYKASHECGTIALPGANSEMCLDHYSSGGDPSLRFSAFTSGSLRSPPALLVHFGSLLINFGALLIDFGSLLIYIGSPRPKFLEESRS